MYGCLVEEEHREGTCGWVGPAHHGLHIDDVDDDTDTKAEDNDNYKAYGNDEAKVDANADYNDDVDDADAVHYYEDHVDDADKDCGTDTDGNNNYDAKATTNDDDVTCPVVVSNSTDTFIAECKAKIQFIDFFSF